MRIEIESFPASLVSMKSYSKFDFCFFIFDSRLNFFLNLAKNQTYIYFILCSKSVY